MKNRVRKMVLFKFKKDQNKMLDQKKLLNGDKKHGN